MDSTDSKHKDWFDDHLVSSFVLQTFGYGTRSIRFCNAIDSPTALTTTIPLHSPYTPSGSHSTASISTLCENLA